MGQVTVFVKRDISDKQFVIGVFTQKQFIDMALDDVFKDDREKLVLTANGYADVPATYNNVCRRLKQKGHVTLELPDPDTPGSRIVAGHLIQVVPNTGYYHAGDTLYKPKPKE